jgi:hypothetical protein
MREIVNREDTQLSRAIDVPPDYQASQPITKALSQIEGLDFEGQISTLREITGNMGYSNMQLIPTQAETGKTASL